VGAPVVIGACQKVSLRTNSRPTSRPEATRRTYAVWRQVAAHIALSFSFEIRKQKKKVFPLKKILAETRQARAAWNTKSTLSRRAPCDVHTRLGRWRARTRSIAALAVVDHVVAIGPRVLYIYIYKRRSRSSLLPARN